MKIIIINSDFFWCTKLDKDYVGTRGFYQAIFDFKKEVVGDSSSEHFLQHYDNYLVYSTRKELPNDLKYEGLIEKLYLKALEWSYI